MNTAKQIEITRGRIVKEEDVPALRVLAEESRQKLIDAGLLKDYTPKPVADDVNDKNAQRIARDRAEKNKATTRSYGLKKKDVKKKKRGDK
jgi:Holliday junction resolvasome RuvABC DNA-binding subunit